MAMAVEKVYEELDEVKVENKKLRVDLKSKAELREHLKKIQNDMLTKIQEESSKTEKQAEQLLEKEEQISAVKQANEDLKRNLCDRETTIMHLNAAIDKMRDAKSQLDCLNLQRENEVATLRHLLGTKESLYKEMEYRAVKLEKENEELLSSLKNSRKPEFRKLEVPLLF
ncbi:hypothetical protein V6N11_082008 [Hibiscus sabdariffa]|uniref:Uncharacterized protein n=1 Tax=Hibiscus sabdariffa TaxID=183260 RepID=A0ABR1ZS02_9ROSI